jgi:N-acetylmuramoyl-L-alanine amidase
MIPSEDIDILARTIFGEARGEYNRPDGGIAALIVIANVVMNRVKQGGWFGSTVKEVCLKPWQFSCWNKNDPNLVFLKEINLSNPIFKVCQQVAKEVSSQRWPDLTEGCDHYFSASLVQSPSWSVGKKPKLRVGRHLFYQLGGK